MDQQQQSQLLETELSRNPSIRRLQHVLDVVLRTEFEDIIKRRDAIYEKVSQQVQFQKLLRDDLKLTSSNDNNTNAGPDRHHHDAKQQQQQQQQRRQQDEDNNTNSNNSNRIHVMHDVGCHFYTQCRLLDPRVVHVNVGKDVIVAMTIDEAMAHSKRAEESYRSRGEKLNRDALAAKYKMRLVMEAIMRLQDIQISKDVAKNR